VSETVNELTPIQKQAFEILLNCRTKPTAEALLILEDLLDLPTRVQKFIDYHVHGALRWEQPLTIPPQITLLQAVVDGSPAPEVPERCGCLWCQGKREPKRRA